MSRKSGAIFFLDSLSAFASMCRRLALPGDSADETWMRILSDNGCSKEEIVSKFNSVKPLQTW